MDDNVNNTDNKRPLTKREQLLIETGFFTEFAIRSMDNRPDILGYLNPCIEETKRLDYESCQEYFN